MVSQEPFGRLVRRYRLEAELTQEALAERAGLSIRAIRDIEAGGKHRPRQDTVDLLLGALRVPEAEQAAIRSAAHVVGPGEEAEHPLEPVETSGQQQGTHASLPIGRFLGSLPPGALVARQDELERINRLVDEAAAGEGRLVLLSGEPGIGKTRLAQEIMVELRKRGAIIGTGRCYEPEQAVPYFAFLDALTTLLHASPVSLRAEIPGRWPFLGKLFPDEIRLSAPPDTGGHDEELLLFRAVTGYLEALSQHTPVALLLDDLHWADTSTLRLLLYLARHTRSAPIFLLGTYRDVEVGRQHPLEGALRDLDREGVVERVQIRRLGENDTGSLIAELMGEPEVSEEFAGLVHGRTEGNPFFVQQVLRVMAERGDVFRRDGRWDRKSVAEIEVPESIRSVIGQRLSRLPDAVQELLRVASVFGQTCRFDDLLVVTDLEERNQEDALERAVASGLVQTIEGDSYTFDHALTQQTLYAELPARRRRRLHAGAAAAIQRQPGARNAELAWHYLQADDAPQALPCALRAGDAALGVFAWSEAELQYRTAVQLAHELGDRAREGAACRKLGDLLLSVGRLDEAIEFLERASEAYLAAGDIDSGALAVIQVGFAWYCRGELTAGIAALQRLLEAHSDETSFPALNLARVHRDFYDAWLRTALGELLTLVERADAQMVQIDDPRHLAVWQSWKGFALRLNGRPADGLKALETGVRLAESTRDPWTQLMCSVVLGEAYLFTGQWENVRNIMKRGVILAERMRNLAHVAYSGGHLGWALTALGNWAEARTALEGAVTLVRSIERAWFSANPYVRLIALCLVEGSWDEAEALLDELMPIVRAIDDPQWLTGANFLRARLEGLRGNPEGVLALVGWIAEPSEPSDMRVLFLVQEGATLVQAYLALGDVDRARSIVDEAFPLAQATGLPPALIPWLLLRAILLARQGQWDDAARAFGEAVELPRQLSMPYDEAQAVFEWGMMLKEAGEPQRAREKLREARGTFSRLGARHDIERSQRALSEL